jgi:hypothetical protein
VSARTRLLAALAPFALAVGGAVLVTWPLALHVSDHVVVPRFFIGFGAVPTSPDTYLHLYILAWVHHALVTGAPLFDANIMYPATGTLAGSEHMLGHWPLYAPVYAAGANRVLAYNWILLSSFVLNALAVHALVRRWTGSAPAGLVAAAIYAWAPLRFAMLDTVQHLNVAYLPLLVLAADRWLENRSVAALVAVSLLTAWQALCSYYLAYATAVVVVVLAAAAWLTHGGVRRGRIAALLAAGLAGFLPTALLARPYLTLRAGGAVPEYGDAWLRAASASPAWFLSPDMALFSGYLALAFAVVGLVTSERLLGAFRATFLIILLVTGFVLVLGPTLSLGGIDLPLPYRLLHALVPGFASLRYPYRFGVLTTLALAVLAGTGFAAFWRHAGGIAWALAGAVALVAGLEYRHAPLRLLATDVGRARRPPFAGSRSTARAAAPRVADPDAPGFSRRLRAEPNDGVQHASLAPNAERVHRLRAAVVRRRRRAGGTAAGCGEPRDADRPDGRAPPRAASRPPTRGRGRRLEPVARGQWMRWACRFPRRRRVCPSDSAPGPPARARRRQRRAADEHVRRRAARAAPSRTAGAPHAVGTARIRWRGARRAAHRSRSRTRERQSGRGSRRSSRASSSYGIAGATEVRRRSRRRRSSAT